MLYWHTYSIKNLPIRKGISTDLLRGFKFAGINLVVNLMVFLFLVPEKWIFCCKRDKYLYYIKYIYF